jgi:hypothetical protein
VISVTPISIEMGKVDYNAQSIDSILTVTNTGNAMLKINSISFSGLYASDFSKAGTCLSTIILLPEASCNITFSVRPTGANQGIQSVNLNISSDGGNKTIPVTYESVATPSVIQLENKKTIGVSVVNQWGPTGNQAYNHEIEGYASATSVNRGGSIDFHVNSIDANYTIDIYRVGWYGGFGARKLLGPIQKTNGIQPAPICPIVEADTNFLECNWNTSHTLNVPNNPADPTDWASGVYLAKLKGSSGKENYIVFVVRDDNRASRILFQPAFTTYAAYDNWGQRPGVPVDGGAAPGKSLYDFNSAVDPITGKPKRAYKVSFKRPFAKNYGTGEFLFQEIRMVRFLEREGYDVSYQSSVDTHTGGSANLQRHKLFMMAGHDEYWSKTMRDNVEAARDNGVNLAFFGANTAYLQIRLEPSINAPSEQNRTVTSYKNAAFDPVVGPESTVRFRDPQINRPEASLLGAMYQKDPVDWYVQIKDVDCPTWLCSNVTFVNNKIVLPGLLGHEIDRVDPLTSPAGTKIIGNSPFCSTLDLAGNKVPLRWTANGLPTSTGIPTSNNVDDCLDNSPNIVTAMDGGTNAHMTYYQTAPSALAPLGAEVFSSGTMFWVYGLDNFSGVRADRLSTTAQQITRNVLNRLGSTDPQAVPVATIIASESLQQEKVSLGAENVGGGCAVSSSKKPFDLSLLLLLFGGMAYRYRRYVKRCLLS